MNEVYSNATFLSFDIGTAKQKAQKEFECVYELDQDRNNSDENALFWTLSPRHFHYRAIGSENATVKCIPNAKFHPKSC